VPGVRGSAYPASSHNTTIRTKRGTLPRSEYRCYGVLHRNSRPERLMSPRVTGAERETAEAPLHPPSVPDARTADPRYARRYGPLPPSSPPPENPDAGTTRLSSPNLNRCVTIAVAAAILGATAFPPFHIVYQGNPINLGYSFLLLPAHVTTFGGSTYAGSVNFGILFVEYIAIFSAGVLAWLVASWIWSALRD
jgi:hypothetical protein